jgi:hypothetical protein
MNLNLDNVETRNATHPDTFEIPTRAAREALRPGNLAKVIITDEDDAERFWVKVTQNIPGGRYVGTIQNHLICFEVPLGEPIEFGPEHVADIWLDAETQWRLFVNNPDRFLIGLKHARVIYRLEYGSPSWARAIDAADAEGLWTETLEALTDLGFMPDDVRAQFIPTPDSGRADENLRTH